MVTETTEPQIERSSASARRVLYGLGVLLLTALVLCLVGSSVVFVDETEFVISERLGHIVAVYDRPADRGLHFKLPWPIGTVRKFDRRVQLFDPPAREIFTRDKKNMDTSFSDLAGEHRTQPVLPETYYFVRQLSMPRLSKRASTRRSDSGYRIYIFAVWRQHLGRGDTKGR